MICLILALSGQRECFLLACLFTTGMIGVMTLEAKFNVYNPCSILTTYHVHCSRIGTRYVRGHNSIRNDPWKVKKVKTSPPVKELRYGPPAPRAKPKPGQRAKKQ